MKNLIRKQTRSIYVLKSFAQDILLIVNSLDAQKKFTIVPQSLFFFEKKINFESWAACIKSS